MNPSARALMPGPPARKAAGGFKGHVALVGHAVRLVGRSAVVVIIVTAGMSALVVGQYHGLTGAGFDVASMTALAANPAIRVLFGPPIGLGDPGGFTVWRLGTPLAVLLAVWALLTAVRMTRGEEEARRWDPLLTGPYRLPRVVGLQLAAVLTGAVAAGSAVTVAMGLAGARLGGSALHGAALALVGTTGALTGGLAAQLIADGRRAATAAAAAVGAGLLLRMIADGSDSLHRLHWLTPFGLIGLAEPFGAARVMPLVVLLFANALLAVAVWVASAHRDLGAGSLSTPGRLHSRLGWFRSLPRFTARRGGGALLAWSTGIWLYFLLIGLLASSLTTFLVDNPAFADLAARAGFGSLTTVPGYLASLFTILAIPLGLYAASRVGAEWVDEESRVLTLMYATPVTRERAFLHQVIAGVSGVAVLSAGAGLASWVGAAAAGTDVSLGAALAGVFNVMPVAWLGLGAALLAFGWWPQLSFAVGTIPTVGGFALQTVGETLRWPEWVVGVSPFRHLAAVPFEEVDGVASATMTGVAAALTVVGLIGFMRRDLGS